MKYEINITYKCNWKCPYCSIKERLQHDINEDEVLKLINSIPDDVSLTLSGGEPGLCSKEYIDKIFNIAEKKHLKLTVNTNGTFIKRFPEYINKICMINLHIEIDKKFNILNLNNVSYILVLTSQNSNKILNFVSKYNNIKWDIIPSTHYNDALNKHTCIKFDTILYKYMNNKSMFYQKTGLRYHRITYLN